MATYLPFRPVQRVVDDLGVETECARTFVRRNAFDVPRDIDAPFERCEDADDLFEMRTVEYRGLPDRMIVLEYFPAVEYAVVRTTFLHTHDADQVSLEIQFEITCERLVEGGVELHHGTMEDDDAFLHQVVELVSEVEFMNHFRNQAAVLFDHEVEDILIATLYEEDEFVIVECPFPPQPITFSV